MTEGAQRTGSDEIAVRPFQVNFPEAELAELRRRINAARWPERETVADDSQGVPLGMIFPGENYQAPRSWTERAYHDLIYYNEPDEGGHFAAWEQPQLFSAEVRAGFRPLRK